jgi:hypothetical protein
VQILSLGQRAGYKFWGSPWALCRLQRLHKLFGIGRSHHSFSALLLKIEDCQRASE